MSRVRWYFKQLLPLKYRTEYGEVLSGGEDVQRHSVVWRMWFGHSFKIDDRLAGGH